MGPCRHSLCTNTRKRPLMSLVHFRPVGLFFFSLMSSSATVTSFGCSISRLLDNGFEVTSYPEGTFAGLSELTFL